MRAMEVGPEFQTAWDAFVRVAPTGSFLQSWAWGDFQAAAGFSPVRLLVQHSDAQKVAAACLCLRRPLPLRHFSLYAPWGPVFHPTLTESETVAVLTELAEKLRALLHGGGVFARLEPKLPAGKSTSHLFTEGGFTPVERSVQPRDTRILDLTQSEDDLLRGMHPKARYNIRLARRHGVHSREDTSSQGLRTFLELSREVARRERFRYHPDTYYQALLDVLAPLDMAMIRVAEYQRIPLAASLLIRFGDVVTYAHGASSQIKKHMMAPYLLHWESILHAKAVGATRYDFFGIAPQGTSVTHPWYGITRFKQGFGGREEHYAGAADMITDGTFHRLYEVGRTVRGFLR